MSRILLPSVKREEVTWMTYCLLWFMLPGYMPLCIALVCTFGTCRGHTLVLGAYQESVAAVSVAPRLPHARMLLQVDTCCELLSSLLCEDCKRGCVPQQLSARPLSGRGRRYPSSEMLVPTLPQEMMMCEVEASCELDVVGSHQKYTACTEPGKYYSLLC